MENQSLAATIKLFGQSTQPNNSKVVGNLNSTFKLYVLPDLGYDTRTMTFAEFNKLCEGLKFSSFVQALIDLSADAEIKTLTALLKYSYNRQFDVLQKQNLVKESTRRNYSSALGQFGGFIESQSFYTAFFAPEEEIPLKGIKFEGCPYSHGANKYPPVELPEHLLVEIEDLRRFWTTSGEKEWEALRAQRKRVNGAEGARPRVDSKTPKSFDKGMRCLIKHFFRHQMTLGVDPNTWHLEMLLDLDRVRAFNTWMLEFGNSHCNALHLLDASLAVAKKTYFSQVRRANWSDIDAVEDVRELRRIYYKKNKIEQKRSKKRKLRYRKLPHEQLQQVCQVLYKHCMTLSRRAKNKHEVVWAWQIFVIVAILTYVAPRQQEPRQYQEDYTLFREVIDGKEIYVARNIHHKMEYLTEETREYCLPSILTPYLDTWFNEYRPLAQKAVQSLTSWLGFWGHKPGDLEKLEQHLTLARQGQPLRPVKDIDKYCENLSKEIRAIRNKIDAWEVARENFERYDTVFFCFGKGHPKSFGKPLSRESLSSAVVRVVGKATKLLFGTSYYINPHFFRNLAARHVRSIGGDMAGTAALRGHSEEMSNDYADSTTDGIDRTKGLDGWWNP